MAKITLTLLTEEDREQFILDNQGLGDLYALL